MKTPVYTDIPGTVPHSAIKHLRTLPPGTALSTPDLAAAIGLDAGGFASCMLLARQAGVVDAKALPGSNRLYWSIGTKPAAVGATRKAPGPRARFKPTTKGNT